MLRSNRLPWLVVFALAAILGVSQTASAQREEGGRERGRPEGRRFGGGFGSPLLRIATNDKVQETLKLSDEQKTKIGELDEQFRKDLRKLFEDRGGMEGVRKLSEETAGKLADVLDDAQKKRLQEISIQTYGVGAVLFAPALAKELDVTDEQRSKLRDAQQAARGGFREWRDLSGDERRAKMEELRAETDKKMLEVLNAEQQKKLESLKGEKVDFDLSELRGPGRGFDGRGGRGRGERGDRQRGDQDRGDAEDDTDKSA